ncbi:MAG: Sua5/YciO/YrdC/YwlC family protein [Pseudomonadota bacterium]
MSRNGPEGASDSPLKLQPACRALAAGGIVAYPTEAVWGFGCDPRNEAAVQKLLALKKRDWRKGLILIAADFSQLQPYVRTVADALLRKALATWPGPHTWLFPAADSAPALVTGGRPTIAVRVTAHPLAAALCRAAGGALVSTSANRSGEPPALTALRVRQRFGAALGAVVSGPLGGLKSPTSIRDLVSGAEVRA